MRYERKPKRASDASRGEEGLVPDDQTGAAPLPDLLDVPAGEKHWHGAAAGTAMTHIAIVDVPDGKSADWMEKVGDDAYEAATAAAE